MMSKKFIYMLLSMVSCTSVATAADDMDLLREGNEKYQEGDYVKADTLFRESLRQNSQNSQTNYNLGNALFRNKKYSEARDYYKASIKVDNSKKDNAAAWHNIGNSYMEEENPNAAEAIKAYKESLKLNPNDDETRYNLIYAQKLQKQQEQQQKQQKQNQQQQQQNQDQKPQEGKEEENKQGDPDARNAESKMDKNQAQQLLEALEQDEKDNQEKQQRQQMKNAKRQRVEKEW